MNSSRTARGDRVSWWAAALMLRGQTEADQRNLGIFSAWCFGWAISFCAVAFALERFPDLQGPLAWLLATIPMVLGVGVIRALLRFLREADEFMRKVQLEGIAIGFGAGQLFCVGYFLLERFGAPHVSMVVAIVPMSFGWAIGSLLVAARYR